MITKIKTYFIKLFLYIRPILIAWIIVAGLPSVIREVGNAANKVAKTLNPPPPKIKAERVKQPSTPLPRP